MQLPEIHFTETNDGVAIAYWSIGSGSPIVITHNFDHSHAEMEWRVPSMVAFYTALAEHHAASKSNVEVEALRQWDAQPLLANVLAPTLVLVSRPGRVATLEEARSLATCIPTARLKSVDGAPVPYFSDREAVLAAISTFLGTPVGSGAASDAGGFTTVVFTDLVASTELLNRLGDVEGRSAFQWLEQTTAGIASDHHGDVIKYTGDGSLVAFSSTSGALAFAVSLMAVMTESPMELRIGMAAGEPIPEGGDLHGAVVHQASRIADEGDAGEIVVADSIRQLALGKGFDFEAAGEATLKGFNEPVRLWKVTGF